MPIERIVLVTRQTKLEALVERFQTRSQAQFYLSAAGEDFGPIAQRHEAYEMSLSAVKGALPADVKSHVIERRFLPQYRFENSDLVVAFGQDGLVANIAKYLSGQPLIAVNPDPATIDGVLLPIQVYEAEAVIQRTLTGRADILAVTMAEARLSDGQCLKAVNDLFVGARSHVSARYCIRRGEVAEEHSSSGLIVSTGVGSTGWLRSIYTGALSIARATHPELELTVPDPLPWDTEELVFNAREPWPSLVTGASIVSGVIARGTSLEIVSRMADGGAIFGDGVEDDYLEFNAGVSASIAKSSTALHMVMG